MATMVGRYELATRNVILPSRGRRFFFSFRTWARSTLKLFDEQNLALISSNIIRSYNYIHTKAILNDK